MTMFRTMRRPLVAIALLLAGCQTYPQPIGATPPASAAATRAFSVRLQAVERPVGRHIQGTARRHMVDDLAAYKIELLRLVDGEWADTGFTHESEGVQGYTFTFEHLGPEVYAVRAQGFDAEGRAITQAAMTSLNLTGPEPALAPTVQLELSLLNVPFDGEVSLPGGDALPEGATGVEVSLFDGWGQRLLGPVSATSAQRTKVKRLAPNRDYFVAMTAIDGQGRMSPATFRYAASVESNEPTLEQVLTPDVTFGAWLAGIERLSLPVEYQSRTVRRGLDGSVWAAGFYGSLRRIDAGGQVTDFTGLSYGSSDLAIDGDGNAWVTRQQHGEVLRITPSDERTTYRVGSGPTSLAIGADAVWVGLQWQQGMSRIDRQTGEVTTTDLAGSVSDVDVDGQGNAWAASLYGHQVTRIAPDGGRIDYPMTYAGGVKIDPSGNAWIGSLYSYGLARVSSEGARTDIPNLPGYGYGRFAFSGGAAWAGSRSLPSLVRIVNDQVAWSSNSLPGPVNALAADGEGGVWAAIADQPTVVHVTAAGAVDVYGTEVPATGLAADAQGHVWIGTRGALLKYTR